MSSKNKKVFSARHIVTDNTTGEILDDKSTTTYVNRQSENFAMYSTTNGLEWAKEYKGYLLFLMVLNQYADNDGILCLSAYRRKEINKFFGWTNISSITNALSFLVSINGIKRLSQNDFMINPETVYKGSTVSKQEKMNRYNSIKTTKTN